MSKNQNKYGPKTDLALDTWVKLARAFAVFNDKSLTNIKSLGLKLPQFLVVEALGHKGPLKIGELCDKMLVSGGNMTLIIDNLENNNYVERVPSKEDRRAILIKLTKEGEALFNTTFKKYADYITGLMTVLSVEEQKNLGKILKKLGLGLQEKV